MMTASQTVLFTVMPRSLAVNPLRLPVSVMVSPRLSGGHRLGSFADWVGWTESLKHDGMVLQFACGGNRAEANIDTSVLRPDLWKALFNERTLVTPHQFDDYSGHGVISFSMRESLSVLKSLYQAASVSLALPEAEAAMAGRERGPDNRQRLAQMLSGLDVHWSPRQAKLLRMQARDRSASGSSRRSGSLDDEGLISPVDDPLSPEQAAASAAQRFAVFYHMPTPTGEAASPLEFDAKTVDFHQALGAIESHPALLRALGLVFDLELPAELCADTAPGAFELLSIERVSHRWRIGTTFRSMPTAVVNLKTGSERFFFTAPRAMDAGNTGPVVLGLLNLDPEQFGLSQVDVDGGMHKAIMLAEAVVNPDPGRNLDPNVQVSDAPNPEVFDPDATLPALRSGGLQLYVDGRSALLRRTITNAAAMNTALQAGATPAEPLFAEDLVRGYRLDIWDSHTGTWHSLHERQGDYRIGADELPFQPGPEEGYLQPASAQPAPGAPADGDGANKDLYVHEVIARWAGWSLSVQMPGKALSRHADPAKAIPPDEDNPDYRTDEVATAFAVAADFRVVPGSLPRLRFGARYRIRARAVDLAGNSLGVDEPLATTLGTIMALPRDPDGLPYLRYEPVGAPLVVIRDPLAVTGLGSAADRLVIRTANDDPSKDDLVGADLTGADRHIVPPRTSLEMGERLGMFDDASGKLRADAAVWSLMADRDAGEFVPLPVPLTVAGRTDSYPFVAADRIDPLPYLPDPLSRSAAIRDLPGAVEGAVGRVGQAGVGGAGEVAVQYVPLSDPNPRPGSATIIDFERGGDWQQTVGFRLALAEPQPGQTELAPRWDDEARVLTVFLQKGQSKVVPLSSVPSPADLDLLGVWRWLRQYIERISVLEAQPVALRPGEPSDRIAHILQRAVEGGHWMLTPPRLLTLVHAVQQPIGHPRFTALNAEQMDVAWNTDPLRASPLRGRSDSEELAPIVAWRRPGATDASLLGAILVHGASTQRVDILSEWNEPVDDVREALPGERIVQGQADGLELAQLAEGFLVAPGAERRPVGYYDPEHDQIAMVRTGGTTTDAARSKLFFSTDAAPRQEFGDTKRRKVRYTAVATSRYAEYFAKGSPVTRSSESVLVDIPSSARPLAPDIVSVIPTFGWQRQTASSIKRSVRFGGGLRVYLRRPWYSSGEGELLGVALWSSQNGPLDSGHRDKLKPYFTQWGMDPIWQTGGLGGAPTVRSFPDAQDSDFAVPLEESSAATGVGKPGLVDVVGFPVTFDPALGLWFADVTINLPTPTYCPFVRLALVRYQPQSLADARISRVVLAGFAQLTPDRSATVTADPYHPRTLRVVVGGVTPHGPKPVGGNPLTSGRPTLIRVRVQRRGAVNSDLAWDDMPATEAKVLRMHDGAADDQPELGLFVGTVTFATAPAAGTIRLLIEEFEFISATYPAAGRLIYAETIGIDEGFAPATT